MPEKSSIAREFGQRIKTLRKDQGISQEELATRCGLDRTYISGIERGVRNVSLRNIELLAKALGVALADLFSGL